MLISLHHRLALRLVDEDGEVAAFRTSLSIYSTAIQVIDIGQTKRQLPRLLQGYAFSTSIGPENTPTISIGHIGARNKRT